MLCAAAMSTARRCARWRHTHTNRGALLTKACKDTHGTHSPPPAAAVHGPSLGAALWWPLARGRGHAVLLIALQLLLSRHKLCARVASTDAQLAEHVKLSQQDRASIAELQRRNSAVVEQQSLRLDAAERGRNRIKEALAAERAQVFELKQQLADVTSQLLLAEEHVQPSVPQPSPNQRKRQARRARVRSARAAEAAEKCDGPSAAAPAPVAHPAAAAAAVPPAGANAAVRRALLRRGRQPAAAAAAPVAAVAVAIDVDAAQPHLRHAAAARSAPANPAPPAGAVPTAAPPPPAPAVAGADAVTAAQAAALRALHPRAAVPLRHRRPVAAAAPPAAAAPTAVAIGAPANPAPPASP